MDGGALGHDEAGGAARATDLQRWQSTFDLMAEQVGADTGFAAAWQQLDALARTRDDEARRIVSAMTARPDFDTFVRELEEWSARPGPYGQFAAIAQHWLPRVRSQCEANLGELEDALATALTTPTSYDDAASSIRLLEETIGVGGPDLSRVPTVLSVLWATDAQADWPILWPGGSDTFQTLGWMGRHLSHAERYVSFAELCRTFSPGSAHVAQRVVTALSEQPVFVGFGTAWPALCEEAAVLHESYRVGQGYPAPEQEARAASLALQLRGHAALVARSLHASLESVTGTKLAETSLQTRTDASSRAAYRSDSHSTWLLPASSGGAPALRVWLTRSGIAVGLLSGWDGASAAERHEELGSRLEQRLPEGVEFIHVRPATSSDRLEPSGTHYPGGEVFVGKWFPHPDGTGRRDLAADIESTVRRLLPIADTMRGAEQSADAVDEELAGALQHFVTERPYPAERDQWHNERRREFAASLEPDALAAFDLATFKRIIASRAYGATGTHSVLDARLAGLDAQGLENLSRAITTLLWGEGDDADRIDAALQPEHEDEVALDEAVVMKLLALAHPHRYLPVYALTGRDGKTALAQALGVVLPRRRDLSRGRLQVLANDRLRGRLEPLLPGDPWGQVQFAQWLLRKEEAVADPERDLIAEAAGELLVDEEFLREIGGLLEDKKQVIFYGPPGTGKTYLAQRYAAALQPDPTKRAIVQFHPSTSYEDFFEGFRPRLDAGGAMVYELRKGPLALLAEAAEADPTTPHVMIIDEINRANLPRVFGELLFLLEYRSHSVQTTYRPDEGFQLPPNLYFIGTMNTADRSIALVDAALRRRFHFLPFMPHEGPMEGLLARWLARENGPVWVAGVVERVNDELRQILRGPHLQIGHSHFMSRDLDDEALRRIWQYGVYPFVEDQLYGREDVLSTFTWDAVRERHEEAARADAASNEAGRTTAVEALVDVGATKPAFE